MSNMVLAQLGGMVKYEFRMHWRRRGVLIVTLSMMFLLAASMLVVTQNPGAIAGGMMGPSSPTQETIMSFALVLSSWAPLSMALAFVFPVVVADAIPLDRQQGVSELLNSLPLRPAVYLSGKLLGVWIVGLSALVLILPVTGVLWRLLIGPYIMRPYLEMAIFGAVGLMALNGGLGLLAASGQPNRRRAVVMVVALPFVFLGGSFGTGSILTYLSPVRGPIIMYFLSGWSEKLYRPPTEFASSDVLLTIAVGLVEIVALGLAATLWMRRKGM